MKVFVGVILNMGIIQLQNLQGYCSTNPTSSIPFFRSVFLEIDFFKSFRCYMWAKLRVPEKKTKPFLDLLVPIIQENYTPHREVAVDESVITFKGRVSFQQYLKGKPNPWGVKAYVLSNSTTYKFILGKRLA